MLEECLILLKKLGVEAKEFLPAQLTHSLGLLNLAYGSPKTERVISLASRIAPQSTSFTPPKKRPEKRKNYLAWLHTLPCVITGQYGVEAAHTSFASPEHGHYGRARSTKAADIFALPLCSYHHAASHSMNEEQWWAKQGKNPHEIALVLWAIYSQYDEYEATERATARIMQGLPK